MKLGIIPVGSNLRGFTKMGITFSTGGILIQGLRHWKANFRGFNLDTHRPFFHLGIIYRQSILPTGKILCRPALYFGRRPNFLAGLLHLHPPSMVHASCASWDAQTLLHVHICGYFAPFAHPLAPFLAPFAQGFLKKP